MMIISFILLFGISISSAAPEASQVINQVLFYESKQSWTERDLELYEKIKKEIVHKDRISQFTENKDEDFLLSRLSAREAMLFEVSALKFKLSEAQRASLAGFSSKEVDSELNQLGLALALVDLKESQLKQKLRFKTWFDLLKRKYQVKIKSVEFKP